eukprot:NODE_2376_length_1215_cov_50.096913_g2168_i0.p1 GENE.NODE_2376_length_1215_cov_50.096913_g2168_i0~~NODE_2376_length_1215_cov_50.096913_g2168_i0.p1  ORF type:complete len:366 (+),score=63.08 NODE_2376_length_1215_cov_50.096913_g2168_i0:97-1098(+)
MAMESFSLKDHKLCVDTSAWGGNVATFGPDAADTEAQEAAFVAAVESGLTLFDTAEVYSNGDCERLLGKFIANYVRAHPESANKIKVATKFFPMPYRLTQESLNKALDASLARLQLPAVDMYQVHGPAFSFRSVEVWAEALAVAAKAGLARTVGVSNYNSDQVQRTCAVLSKHGLALASNQIEYSLLHRLPETTGLIKTCKDSGVAILAYSPLAMGRLTGKYTAENQPAGQRRFGACPPEVLEPLLDAMRSIAASHEAALRRDDAAAAGVTCSQVALNWVIAKGGIPICGAKNASQALDNSLCLRWSLTDDEVAQLDKLSNTGQASFWQGSSK